MEELEYGMGGVLIHDLIGYVREWVVKEGLQGPDV
jgi:hypothetical protein